jgi:hypothetical protein
VDPSIRISSSAAAWPSVRGLAAGGEAAGLVSYKTSGPPFLDISFAPDIVKERRVNKLRRQVWACGHLQRFATPKGFRENVWFVTLTYRGVDDWRPGHISRCYRALRKWCRKLGVPFRYLWVAELQKRGALHYHVAIWLPKRIQLPKFDKQGWWPHGMTQRVIAKNAVGYLMKYLSKISPFHTFPKGVRIHGFGGLTQQARGICSWLNLPSWCKQRFGVGELQTVAGRRVVRATGEILEAMYPRVIQPSGMRLYANGPIPERWADGPYSSIDRFVGAAGTT